MKQTARCRQRLRGKQPGQTLQQNSDGTMTQTQAPAALAGLQAKRILPMKNGDDDVKDGGYAMPVGSASGGELVKPPALMGGGRDQPAPHAADIGAGGPPSKRARAVS